MPSLVLTSLLQAVVITDPALSQAIVRSKEVDKFRFMYHFMDEASLRSISLHA